MKKILLCGFALSCLTSAATIDCPDVKTFNGTGYYAGGWFDYLVSVHSDGDALLFSDKTRYVVSPHYPRPIRKVVLSVYATQADPARYLRLLPYVNGHEMTTNQFDVAVRHLAVAEEYEFVTFDFDETQSVDAFRLSLDGVGSAGSWRVAKICVVYGTREADEDVRLKEFANELPMPEDPRVVDFTKTSLSLAATAVEEAVGYRFRISRLEGTPLSECREDFDSIADGLKMSDGWTLSCANAKVFACTESSGSTYVDKEGSSVMRALKIEKGNETSTPVRVEIISPRVPEVVKGYSFASKRSSGDASNAVVVYGRKEGSVTWEQLDDAAFAIGTSMTTTEKGVDENEGIVQVKFVFVAEDPANCRPCALDTLRVIYGGNESRELVESGTEVLPSPAYTANGLETARYEYQVQAVGGRHRDSSWTPPQVLDLNWADLTVSAPTGIVTDAADGKLTVSWTPVDGADHYLVTVVSVDDPDQFALCNQKTAATTLTLAVPHVGDYAVTVTAVAPGGRATAASAETTGTVVLDELGDVTVEAVDRQTIVATWKTIPLAESYQAKLVRVSGNAETVEYGWQAEEKRILLPEGWSSHVEWEHDSWTSSSTSCPRLPYTGCWIASSDRGQPITKLVCRYKCGGSSAAVLDCTRMLVEVYEGSGGWKTLAETTVSTKLTELSQTFEASRDVRCVRLTCLSVSARTMGDVAIGKVALTYGAETHAEVDSVSVAKGEATFRGLDPKGRYRVVVAPQPSEGVTSSSTTIDLANERFRMTGAIPLGTLRHCLYEESFDCLSNVVADTQTRKCGLDWWQLFKGSGEVEKLLYTAGTARTTGGVYAFGGTEGAPMLGTLATSTLGCTVGLAFRNDGTTPIDVQAISFETVQRTLKGKTATYELEYLLTDGACGIDAEGDWQSLVIPETASCLDAFPNGDDYRMSVSLTTGMGLPTLRIPAGGVFILRWQHKKLAGGPMMAIDDVRVEFRKSVGFCLLVK